MSIRHFAMIGMAIVILALIASFTFTKPQTLRRPCGDPYNLSSLLSSITGLRLGSTHCCYANSVIADLKQIDGAMETYRFENGAYPTSFEQLTNYIRESEARFRLYRLQSDGKHWTVRVPQHSPLPGHYLLTDQGSHLYFSAAGPATTKDVDLFDRR
jgi:hypothetical protein